MEGKLLTLMVSANVIHSLLGRYLYKVKDTLHGEVFTVDLSITSNPCSCHQPKWQKIPCIHVIRVLNWKKEFWRVWEFVGKEYTLSRVEDTCDYLSKDEFNFLKWIHNVLPEMSNGNAFSRSFRMNNGINTARIPSTGEGSNDVYCVS